jgi:hypothetical protein
MPQQENAPASRRADQHVKRETTMPLALTDDQLATIQNYAAPLHANQRGAFLEEVVGLLRGCELGDGILVRACREAQKKFLRPADLRAGNGASKYR